MANPNDIARAEMRAFLLALRDALDQPPLPTKPWRTMDRLLDLLTEQDLGKRLVVRDRLDALVAELDGRADL